MHNIISTQPNSYCANIWLQPEVLKKDKISSFKNVADVMTYLQAMLNKSLGLEMLYLPVSSLSESKAFLDYVTDIISNAYHFAMIYNSAITNQIQKRNLKDQYYLIIP